MDAEIREIVENHKTPCVVGSISALDASPIGCSKKGGFPDVDDDFEWPSYQGKHLSFIAQIEARHFLRNETPGILSFYWNERNWGGGIKDDGAFRVLYTEHPATRLDVAPQSEYKAFGLLRRRHSPRHGRKRAWTSATRSAFPQLNDWIT